MDLTPADGHQITGVSNVDQAIDPVHGEAHRGLGSDTWHVGALDSHMVDPDVRRSYQGDVVVALRHPPVLVSFGETVAKTAQLQVADDHVLLAVDHYLRTGQSGARLSHNRHVRGDVQPDCGELIGG